MMDESWAVYLAVLKAGVMVGRRADWKVVSKAAPTAILRAAQRAAKTVDEKAGLWAESSAVCLVGWKDSRWVALTAELMVVPKAEWKVALKGTRMAASKAVLRAGWTVV